MAQDSALLARLRPLRAKRVGAFSRDYKLRLRAQHSGPNGLTPLLLLLLELSFPAPFLHLRIVRAEG